MRKITAVFAVCMLFAAGSCDNRNQGVEDAKKSIEDAGKGLTDTLQKSKDFGAEASLKAFQVSIAAFKAANGKYPADLKELSDFSGVAASADVYDYDPDAGKLTLKRG